MLRPCVEAIRELSANYGASIVLCTATQPALRKADGFTNGLEIAPDRELAPDPQALYKEPKRVEVEHVGPRTDAEIAARFAEQPQMLCIVNSRKHARVLHAHIKDRHNARHLTTLMCPAHRRQVLAQVRDELANGKPVRLVATSLIEAGVDGVFRRSGARKPDWTASLRRPGAATARASWRLGVWLCSKPQERSCPEYFANPETPCAKRSALTEKTR